MSAQCKGCGKQIIWGKTGQGKMIPLDPKPPVYVVSQNLNNPNEWFAERHMHAAVSHFATCPKANDFSASKKPK